VWDGEVADRFSGEEKRDRESRYEDVDVSWQGQMQLLAGGTDIKSGRNGYK